MSRAMSSAPVARSHHYPRAATAIRSGRLLPSSRRLLNLSSISTSTSSSVSASASPASSPSSTAEDLASWLEARGGSAPLDRVAVFAEGASKGFALRCVSGASANEVLIRLPASCLLNGDDDASSSPSSPSPPSSSSSSLLPGEVEAAVSRLCSRVPTELWGARLALRLLAHRAAGEASPLAPYLRALPSGVPGVPIFYPREAIETLGEYAPVGTQVLKRCRFLATFVQQEGLDEAEEGSDAAVAFSGARVDANALAWAFSVASSRAFRVRGEGRAPSCLPLIDMANHDFAPTAKVVPWREGGGGGGGGGGDKSGSGSNSSSSNSGGSGGGGNRGGVALVATSDLAPGTPLTFNYGALPSDFFLLDYGFFFPYPRNPFDVVKLRWSQALVDAAAEFARIKMPSGGASSSSSSLSSSSWKAAALAPLSLQSDPEVQVLAGAPWVDRRFLAAARVAAAASQADVRGRSLALSSSSSSSSKSDPSLADLDRGFLTDPAAEVRALRLLGGACLLSLSSFPTTPEQDRAILALGPSEEGALTNPDEVIARRFILSKKEILERAAKELGRRARAAAARAKGGSGGSGGGGEKSKGFGKK